MNAELAFGKDLVQYANGAAMHHQGICLYNGCGGENRPLYMSQCRMQVNVILQHARSDLTGIRHGAHGVNEPTCG